MAFARVPEGMRPEKAAPLLCAGVTTFNALRDSGARPGDLAINVCRKKHVTNHRKSFAEDGILLTPPRILSLDEAIEYIAPDELVEVTPASIRLRKRELDADKRHRVDKQVKLERLAVMAV